MRFPVLALVLCGCHAILPLGGPTENDGGGPPDADLGDASFDGQAGDAAGDGVSDAVGDGPIPPADITRHWKNQIDAGPGALHNTVAVYHAKRQSVVLYGGTNCSGFASSVLWEYKNGMWKVPCATCGSGPRAGHALVYDTKRDRLVLYGGVAKEGNNPPALGDLWEWGDLSLPPALVFPDGPSSPEPLTDAFASYDPVRGRMVIFGGHTASTTAAKNLRNDVWEYDGTRWHGPLPATGPRPDRRFSYPQSMTFVPAPAHAKLANRSVFCGGRDESYSYDDCWTWDGTAWQKLCDNCTGEKRFSAPLVFDPVVRQLYLMGGYGSGFEIAGTWTSGDGHNWTVLDAAMPKARDTMAAAYHAADDAVVIYGGNGQPPCGCSGGVYPWSKNCDEMLLYVQQP